MIPCPYCDREFEKRAGLMRHVTSSHPSEGAVPTNPGGAIETVVPVNPHAYDSGSRPEDFDVEPPVELSNGVHIGDVITIPEPYPHAYLGATVSAYGDGFADPPTSAAPTPEQYTRIRALIRQGRTETEAWMTVVGHEPPPRPPQPVDGRPLRLQQVAFRVRNTEIDQIDASWLLRLAEIGLDAIAQLQHAVDSGLLPLSWENADANPIIERWNEAIA